MENKFRLEFEDGTTKTVKAEIKLPKDIIQFVAGTTDPVNTKGIKDEANKDYWRGADNLWKHVKDLKPQFLDLHVQEEFFSWSGDNSTDERTKGAERLLDVLLRTYSNWKKKEVHLHLIGHSHGGNVINQFTEIIANSTDFPEFWKIKSITYLSTPFFQEQHQLNPGKLHADCKIINVHNDYDITQRFVADFTLHNLEHLIGNFIEKDRLDDAVTALKAIDMEPFDNLTDISIDNHTEGPALWTATRDVFVQAEILMDVVQKNLAFIGSRTVVSPEKQEFLSIINDIHAYFVARIPVLTGNLTGRDGGYGRSEYEVDIDLAGALTDINRIVNITTDESDSFLLNFLDNLFTDKDNGLLSKIDDTSTSPEKQVNGQFPIEDFDITDLDIYNKRGKKADFEKFATGVEDAMKRDDENSLKEILMRMMSQFINPDDLDGVISKIYWAEIIFTGEIDTQLKDLRRNLGVYHGLIEEYNQDLITAKDIADEKLKIKPGSIPYLAMTSHGLSHTSLFDDSKHDVKSALKSAFSSGKNPGYKE